MEECDIWERLYAAARDKQYRLAHYGLNTMAELVGWVRPDVAPPRNGRTSKALRALGYDVKVYQGASSIEPDNSGGEMDGAKEVAGDPVVAGGNAAILLELVEGLLNQVRRPVEVFVGGFESEPRSLLASVHCMPGDIVRDNDTIVPFLLCSIRRAKSEALSPHVNGQH